MRFLVWLVLVISVSPWQPFVESASAESRHSFRPPFYVVRGTSIPFWKFGGSTVVTENSIRLTEDIQSQRGFIWNTVPVNSPSGWEAVIEFKIHGAGRVGADGIAFWYTKPQGVEGPVFGNNDKWSGLAVFIDTFDNNGNGQPIIAAALNNGTVEYKPDVDGENLFLDKCTAALIRNPAKNSLLRVSYSAANSTLRIDTDLQGSGQYRSCLVKENVQLPTSGSFFGLSAATGGLTDNHELFSFVAEFLNRDETVASRRSSMNRFTKQEDQKQQKQQQQQQPEEAAMHAAAVADQQQQQQQQPAEPPPAVAQAVSPPPPPPPTPPQKQRQQQQTQTQQQQQQAAGVESHWQELQTQIAQIRDDDRAGRDQLVGMINSLQRTVNQLNSQQQSLQQAVTQLHERSPQQGDEVDIAALTDLVASVSAALGPLRNTLMEMHSSVQQRLPKLDSVNLNVEDALRTVRLIKSVLDTVSSDQKNLLSNVQTASQELVSHVEKNTSFSFWTFFLFFQALFFIAFVWWKKVRDEHNRKYL